MQQPQPEESLSTIPPLPGGSEEDKRRAEARRRVRLMTGQWFGDLQRHMAQHFDAVRERIVGKPDLSTNLLKSVARQLGALYDRPPTIHHEEARSAEVATAVLEAAGWQALGTRVQRFAIAIRECLLRPTLTNKGLLLRVVTPDLVHAVASSDEPDVPVRVVEARVRSLRGRDRWLWDDLDIRDPAAPVYRVMLPRQEPAEPEDVTEEVLGGPMSGPAYPFRGADGAPVLPYALYHAERTNELWSWGEDVEAVEGTLTDAVLWSWWLHNVRDAAWAQRWGLDVEPRGAGSAGAGRSRTSSVATDPSSVFLLRSSGDRASVGQWNPPIDPLTLGTALAEFEQRLLVHFGLSSSDVERTTGGPESGYAITLRRDSVREAQRRFAAQFERADRQLLRIVAALLRAVAGPIQMADDGYSIVYPGPPRSASETTAEIERMEMMIAHGLASRVDAYMAMHPGLLREQALTELERIAAENRMLGVMPGQPTRTP